MAAVNTREIVLDMLLMVERGEEYSHRIIHSVLDKYDYLSGQEKAFMKRLFEGCIERKEEITFYINHFASIPMHKMKPLIRCLLYMGTYQILYMDSVPDAAAVSEAVKLAGKRKFRNLSGFVNGILRKVAASKKTLPMPDEEKEPALYLSVRYSMPEWLVEHFLTFYSYDDTEKIMDGLLRIRPVCIRFASGLTEEERKGLVQEMEQSGVQVIAHPEVVGACYLKNCENITTLPGFANGAFTVQDASSMLAVAAAGIKPGDFVLDVCAAPGGKSMLAAEYAGADGYVEARDVSGYKVAQIEENIKRMGLLNVSTKIWDARVADETVKERADVVIADVPCSGLGVMGKKRDIKYRQTPETLKEIIQLQKEIAGNAALYVKEGGVLLYSTCTINPAENEEMAEWICREFSFVQETAVQLLPGIQDTDGFFYARLRKGRSRKSEG